MCMSMCEGQISNSGMFPLSATIHSISRWPGTCKQARLAAEQVPDLPPPYHSTGIFTSLVLYIGSSLSTN